MVLGRRHFLPEDSRSGRRKPLFLVFLSREGCPVSSTATFHHHERPGLVLELDGGPDRRVAQKGEAET